MTTGDIATWVIFAVIVIGFLFGLKRIYHNFLQENVILVVQIMVVLAVAIVIAVEQIIS